jgi:hypothetical protein
MHWRRSSSEARRGVDDRTRQRCRSAQFVTSDGPAAIQQRTLHSPRINDLLAGEMNERRNAGHIQCPGDEVVSAFDLPAHAQRTVRCGYERWMADA